VLFDFKIFQVGFTARATVFLFDCKYYSLLLSDIGASSGVFKISP
jgi:hypothetical protein